MPKHASVNGQARQETGKTHSDLSLNDNTKYCRSCPSRPRKPALHRFFLKNAGVNNIMSQLKER